MSQLIAYCAEKIFTGDEWLHSHAVVADPDGTIDSIVPTHELNAEITKEEFPKGNLVPAFIDIQIYGAYEKLFSVFPEPDALSKLNDYCGSGGACFCVPTIATNTYEVFRKGIDAVREYWSNGGMGVLGLHIEGPWINTIKRGAHITELIHSPTVEQARELLEYGKGVIKIITLAPEICSKEVIELVQSYGVVVSAGHSNATYEQATKSFDESGIKTCTHLFNAMSPLQHRAPGLVGAIFDHDSVMASIIPDGHHVDFAAVRIAATQMKERLFVITDAVTATSAGPYQHVFSGDKYDSNGILSGSSLKMNKAVFNLVHHAEVNIDDALRMCSLYPAKAIGMDGRLGRIRKGFDTKMVVLSEEFEMIKLIG